jgi:hypothetical protein
MLKTQYRLWLPILVGTTLFTIGGLLHIAEHTFWQSPEANLTHEIVIVIGFSFFVLSVSRYFRLQEDYYRLKSEALKKLDTHAT